MKKAIYILSIITSLSSCSSTYFYSILDSKTEYTEKVENGDFVFEDDNLWIAHCFKGESAPVQITVFNKTDSTLYLDWHKSALIINNRVYSYVKYNKPINNHINGYTLRENLPQLFDQDGEMRIDPNPTSYMTSYISTIPPKTMVSHQPIILGDIRFDSIKGYTSQKMGDSDTLVTKVNRKTFTEEDSPLRLQSNLIMYINKDDPMLYEQKFYLSNIIKTNEIKPRNLPTTFADKGDLFYIEKQSKNKAFGNGVAAVLLLIGGITLEIIANPSGDSGGD